MLGILTNPGVSLQDKFILAVALVFAMVIALCMHELAHGVVAYWNGDMTAKMAGRLTLNPLKHLDLMGTLLLLVAGFGWAKPVPINSNNFTHQKRGIFTVSIAGVATNLILAILNCLLLMLTIFCASSIGIANVVADVAYKLFYYFFMYSIVINLTLMAFNLLPIYPLDGFHVVEAFTRYDNKFCVFMRRYGNMILFGVLIIGSIVSSIGSMIGGKAGYYLQYFDIIGQYIRLVTEGFGKLMTLIFGV